MTYVALLRGINVGGKGIIKMEALRQVFEDAGYQQVRTYIQSGNVIFESSEKSSVNIEQKLEALIVKKFHVDSRVVILSRTQFKKVLQEVPTSWKQRTDIRCYVAFLKAPAVAKDVAEVVTLKEGVDSLKLGKHAVYMTTQLSELTKSRFNTLAGTKIYKLLTIRNYNTCKKILTLMEPVPATKT